MDHGISSPTTKNFKAYSGLNRYSDQLSELINRLNTTKNQRLRYGTSGIRCHHSHLPRAVAKCTLFQVFHSIFDKSKPVGLMITASHNPEPDNGVKLTDSVGKIFPTSWEPFLTRFVNSTAEPVSELLEFFVAVKPKGKANGESPKKNQKTAIGDEQGGKALLFIGRDSRSHSDSLVDVAKSVLAVMHEVVSFRDLGYVSTPLLFRVVTKASLYGFEKFSVKPFSEYIDSWRALERSFKDLYDFLGNKSRYEPVSVDCANGVGSLQLKLMEGKGSLFDVKIYNSFRSGAINTNCGSEFVQKTKTSPKNTKKGVNFSLDGDADRAIIFYPKMDISEKKEVKKGHDIVILKGDRILCLFVLMLKKLTEMANSFFSSNDYSSGIVQTGYANGESIKFLKEKGFKTAIAGTGLKNVVRKSKKFDLGVYFEANGHGSVYLSQRLKLAIEQELIKGDKNRNEGKAERLSLRCLLDIINASNQNYADAVATVYLCRVAMRLLEIDEKGIKTLYDDYPFVQLRVNCKPKQKLECSEDQTRIIKPVEMQEEIDKLLAEHKSTQARCFVRESGTEVFDKIGYLFMLIAHC